MSSVKSYQNKQSTETVCGKLSPHAFSRMADIPRGVGGVEPSFDQESCSLGDSQTFFRHFAGERDQ